MQIFRLIDYYDLESEEEDGEFLDRLFEHLYGVCHDRERTTLVNIEVAEAPQCHFSFQDDCLNGLTI